MKRFTTAVLFLIAAGFVSAQTLVTYTMEGAGCNGVYGCEVSPAMDVNSPWGSTTVVGGGTPGAHYSVVTGLNVTLSGYPSFAAIPQHLVGAGSGIFDWFDGAGNGPDNSGTFMTALPCTWDYTPIPNPILPNNPIREFTEVCTSDTDPQGQSVTFTRHWVANPGRFGRWFLTRLVEGNLGAGSIVDTSTLTIVHP